MVIRGSLSMPLVMRYVHSLCAGCGNLLCECSCADPDDAGEKDGAWNGNGFGRER